ALRAPAVVESAGTACMSSTPVSAAYTVTVCLSAPADGATVSEDLTVSGTVSVIGTNQGIAKTVFFVRGAYLLTDYASPYTFTLSTAKFVDGSATLEVEADMRDGFESAHATVSLTFSNGVTTPPVNTGSFTPKTPAPPSGQPLIIAAAGDGASGEPTATNVTNLIATMDPDMFLYLGDVYENGTPTEFQNWYGTSSTFFGQFKGKTNPNVGNHEYAGGLTAPGYFDYWDNIPNYYSYNDAGWHFIALNSTCTSVGGCNTDSPQYQWLQADLAANQQPCTIAYFHQPLYSVGPRGDNPFMSSIWSLLNTYSVDLVLAAHDHNYQRWLPLDASGNPSPAGITSFVVGTGGHGVQPFSRADSRMAVGFDSLTNGIGALKLALGTGSATYEYVSTTAGLLDSGSLSCTVPDTTPPTAPLNLTATPLSSNRVDLAWSPATDNVQVVGYDISRGGFFLSSISGSKLTFADTSVLESTTYTYTVKARDIAGNVSASSNQATATTATGSSPPVFADDFDSCTLTGWTNVGVICQIQEAHSGAAARATATTATAVWAWHTITTQTNSYTRIRFKVISQGANNLYLMKFRTGTGASIGGLYLGGAGNTLTYRNDVAATTVRSPRTASAAVWHELQVHLVINGASGQIETWLDGTKVPELSKTDNFGSTPYGRVQIADNSGSRLYDLAVDDLVIASQFISSAPPVDTSPPTAPGNASATAVSSNRVNVSWAPSLDDVGVVAYDLFRDAEPLDTVIASSTSYSDSSADPATRYSYTIKARDLAGNTSPASNPASATTPATVPGAPTSLTATAANEQVGLSWTAPASNGGAAISAYKVYRGTTSGGETLLLTLGDVNSYNDAAVTIGTTYFYRVSAVNAAGESGPSNEASASPTTPPPLLTEGFEGGLTGWTVTGPVAIDTLSPHAGTQDARIQCAGAACWAHRAFAGGQTVSDLWLQTWVNVATIDTKSTFLLKLRTAGSGTGVSVVGIYLNNKGRLSFRNDAAGLSVAGSHVVTAGWHRVTVHLIVGTGGRIDMWLDGTSLTELNRTADFGTAAIGRLQIGENSTGRTFDARLDDIVASPIAITP
ncbi:MAG: fibronectin type III domain-containing protein, partial [Mycobacteriales bacterium]